jgi:hypothetical protein
MPKESTKVSKTQEAEVEYNSPDDHFVHIKDLDVEQITLPAIDDKRSSDSRYHIFPTYKYGKQQDKIVFVTDDIKITKGGIPKLDDKWRKNDSKREFFWLGWDKEQESCNSLFEKLKEIDEKYDALISYDVDTKDDKNVESQVIHLLKDKKKEPLNVLEYTPLVRMSVQGGDGAQKPDQPEYAPYERIKIKFQKKWDKNKKEGDLSELTTVLFLGDKEEEEDLTYPSDFEKYLRWNCTARFVCQITKFGCKKTIEKDKKGKQVPRECGFDITVLQVVITKEAPTSGASTADKYRKRMFPKLGAVPTQTVDKKQNKQESSDESSAEESEAEVQQTTKNTKKNVKSDSESEKSEDDEPAPSKTDKTKSAKKEAQAPAKKQTKKVDSESESSSESEASDSEDSNDSSSEEKPAPKSSKKSSR